MHDAPIRVLIVDDSFTMRLLVSDLLISEPNIEVELANSGIEAIAKLPSLKPDCILLDIVMPGMDGITTLKHIMQKYPTPVIILSAHSKKNGDNFNKCLAMGAFDVIEKPSGEISFDIDTVKLELLEKIKKAVAEPHAEFDNKKKNILHCSKLLFNSDKLFIMGSSMGGPYAIENILSKIPANFPIPIVIIQHIPSEFFLKNLVKRLNKKCWIHVKILENQEILSGGTAYYVPYGNFIKLKNHTSGQYCCELVKDSCQYNSPSVDSNMISIAQEFKGDLVGIILSGMGDDGLEGMKKIKAVGGLTIAQDERDAILYGMPKAVKDAGIADKVLSVESITQTMMEYGRHE